MVASIWRLVRGATGAQLFQVPGRRAARQGGCGGLPGWCAAALGGAFWRRRWSARRTVNRFETQQMRLGPAPLIQLIARERETEAGGVALTLTLIFVTDSNAASCRKLLLLSYLP